MGTPSSKVSLVTEVMGKDVTCFRIDIFGWLSSVGLRMLGLGFKVQGFRSRVWVLELRA